LRQAATPSVAGETKLQVVSRNDNVSGTGSTLTVLSRAIEAGAITDISSHMSGDTVDSVLSSVSLHAYNSSTGLYTDAIVAVYAEAVNEGLGIVLLGNSSTDVVGFADADLDTATLGWSRDYLPVSNSALDWDEWDEYFGSDGSLLGGILLSFKEVLYVPTGTTPLASASGVVSVDAAYGNVFDIAVSESITSITFSNMLGPLSNVYYGRSIKLRFVFSGSYTVALSAFAGGLFASGDTDIVGTSGDVYLVYVDELGGSKRYCSIKGPYSS
jgi:hypothetical protein